MDQVRELNEAARERMREAGDLGDDVRLRGDDYGGRLTTTTMAGWGSLRPT